jgi:hypothetical protein
MEKPPPPEQPDNANSASCYTAWQRFYLPNKKNSTVPCQESAKTTVRALFDNSAAGVYTIIN